MKVMTKKAILANLNGKNDLTKKSDAELSGMRFDVLGVSYGVYGKNAGLFKERKTGAVFVIPSRCMLLLRYID